MTDVRCDEIALLRGAYLDAELSPSDRESVESHLETCSACAASIRELQNVDLVIRNASEPRLTAAERQRMVNALARPALPWRRLAAAAILAAALPLGISAWFARGRDVACCDLITPAIDTSL